MGPSLGSDFSEARPLNELYQDVDGRPEAAVFCPVLCFKGDTIEERATKNLIKWLMPWHAPTAAAGELPEAGNMSTPHFLVRPLLKC